MIQRHAQFWFFRKGSGNSFSTTSCLWSFIKKVSVLYSINWPNFIIWLPLLLEILCNTFIAIICLWFINFRGCLYAGELARSDQLAHLGEILPSLGYSYKEYNVLIWRVSQHNGVMLEKYAPSSMHQAVFSLLKK